MPTELPTRRRPSPLVRTLFLTSGTASVSLSLLAVFLGLTAGSGSDYCLAFLCIVLAAAPLRTARHLLQRYGDPG